MADNSFRPTAPRYGINASFADGNFGGGAVQLVASGTATVPLGNVSRKCYIRAAAVSQFALGTYGGTATIQFFRVTGSGLTTVTLTAAQDITGTSQTAKTTFLIPLLSTLTDPQRIFLPYQPAVGSNAAVPGDFLYANIVLSSTVSTQPVGGACTIELEVMT
jgi:hypothetical protein